MSGRPGEQSTIHTRLLKCPLEVEHARAWWHNSQVATDVGNTAVVERAFEERWFGARSLPRVEVLITNFRERFDAIPNAISVLSQWREINVLTRALICHWHLQFADPLYRSFAGEFLVGRFHEGLTTIRRDTATNWISQQTGERWKMPTRIKFASRLLACACSAGLLKAERDPRTIQQPRVTDDALSYLVHLLREFDFDGTLLDNPYLRSVGLAGRELESRLRNLPSVQFQRQGDVVDIQWQFADLAEWGASTVSSQPSLANLEVA
ncbi:MAG: DUF1819 family protein [Planctomycetota bacterium]|nr:DUF1819 family protein [Planctomycetota bacterium]